MILPRCSCRHPDASHVHVASCPSVAEPQPLNAAQIRAEATIVAHSVLSLTLPDGSPRFPNLATHAQPA